MIISNNTGATMQYYVQNASSQFKDSGTINKSSYVEFQPRGQAPFAVGWTSINLNNVPSPAIVTFWQGGGDFSQ